MGRFIIAAENLTKVQADSLTGFLSNSGFGYWHWVEHTWLVIDSKHNSAKELYVDITTKLLDLEPKTMVILRLDEPRSHWGRASKNGWAWLAQNDWGSAT